MKAETARLEVCGLTKAYGPHRALAGVTFACDDGIVGLLGPNGAGKSSLLRCVAGLQPWDEGNVVVDGIDAARQPRLARAVVGYMPERVAFPREMRVAPYLKFVAAAKGLPRSRRRAAAAQAIERFGLGGVATRIIGNLSKGWRQRLALAQTLVADPAVLLLDEATAGLDPVAIIDIHAALVEYGADHLVVLSTHSLAEARGLCSEVLILNEGRIAHRGPGFDLVADDWHETFRSAIAVPCRTP